MTKSMFLSTTIFVFIMNAGFNGAMANSTAPQGHSMQNHGSMDHTKMKHGAMDHGTMDYGAISDAALPTEPGQGAFATIAEIVEILTNDTKTDWTKVNINALREHLIDMNEVALNATAETKIFDTKIVFKITGSGRTKQAIQAMVPAHSSVLSRTTDWDIKGELTEHGATMTVVSNNEDVLQKVKALGFYGVMATGAHHQAHHFAMAKGDNHVHAHN